MLNEPSSPSLPPSGQETTQVELEEPAEGVLV